MIDAQKHIIAIILLLLLLKMIIWTKNTNILKSIDLLWQVDSRDANKIWKKEQWTRGEFLASSFRTCCGDPQQVSFPICTSYYLSLITNRLDLLSKVPKLYYQCFNGFNTTRTKMVMRVQFLLHPIFGIWLFLINISYWNK